MRKKIHNLKNLEIELGDAENLDFDNKYFDIAYIYMALHHFPSHQISVSEACRVSREIIFVDIMDAGITRFLNFFGLYDKEGPEIVPNRLEEKKIKKILKENGLKMDIQYFFYPPYYGNNSIVFITIRFLSKIVNYSMKIKPFTYLFGNVAIMKGTTYKKY